MNLIEVNRQTCNHDGICAAVCPIKVIDFEEGGYPSAVAEADELCIRCGHCVAACPNQSLEHRDIATEMCPPVRKELRLSAEQCEHFLRSRRSIRVYRQESVPRETLGKLIEVARYAPTGKNSQCVEWLVLDDREELRRLATIVCDWMRWLEANLPDLAKTMRVDWAIAGWERGDDIFLRSAPALIVAHGDKENRMVPSACTIALTYLELAATSMDLGCCWAGYLNAAATTYPPMQEALGLPSGHNCFGAMMLGFPKLQYQRLPPRKPPVITWRP